MTENLQGLVPQIKQWFHDHGAVFPTVPVDGGLALIDWAPTETTEERAEIKRATEHQTRSLVIGEPLETMVGLASMIAIPECWEYAVGRLIEGSEAVFARYVSHRDPEYGPYGETIPERIQVRLSVIPRAVEK